METKKKFALIKFNGHKKKLTYFSQEGTSDLKAVKDAILSSKDDAISQNVKNCTDVIIEIFDTDIGAKVELSSDEVLDTVSELDVSFVYELLQLPEQDLISKQQIEDLSEILPKTSSSECAFDVIIEPSQNTPHSSEDEFAVTDTIPRQKRKNKSKLNFPVKLPKLPDYLRKLIDYANSPSQKLKVLAKSGHFIRLWASDLLALTDGNPTPNDYRYYATSIVTTFSLFADETSSPHKSIAKQLSSCIRNRRAWERRTSGVTTCKNITQPNIKPNIHLNIKDVLNAAASPALSAKNDTTTLMKEIKKLSATTKDIGHVKILLRQTFNERREWIKNTASGISAVANEFKILINPELLLFEYKLMGYAINFEEKWLEMVKKILEYFQITAEENQNDRLN